MAMLNRTTSLLVLATLGSCGSLAAHAQAGKSGEQVYQEVCFACHATGLEKAPKFGDRTMWAPLIKEGQTKLTADAWVGQRGMPAKGGKPDLGLEEFSDAVAHMARAGGAKWKDPDAAMHKRILEKIESRIASLKAKQK